MCGIDIRCAAFQGKTVGNLIYFHIFAIGAFYPFIYSLGMYLYSLILLIEDMMKGQMRVEKASVLFVWLLMGLFAMSIPSIAHAEKYRVAVNSVLNVRSQATTLSSKVGELKKDTVVEVKDIKQGWARIDFHAKDAYVHSKYLVSTSDKTTVVTYSAQEMYLIIAIVVLVAVSLLPTLWGKQRPFSGKLQYKNVACWALVFILELYYIFGVGGDLWFCNPSQVGWGKAIVHFLVFGFIALYQFLSLQSCLGELAYNHADKSIDYRTGFYAIYALPLALIVVSIYDSRFVSYVFVVFGLAQLVQFFSHCQRLWSQCFCYLYDNSFLYLGCCFNLGGYYHGVGDSCYVGFSVYCLGYCRQVDG